MNRSMSFLSSFCFRDMTLNLVSTSYFCWTCLPCELQALLADNIHTHYGNKSLWNGKQYHFFVELTKTNCFHHRISGQIAWSGGPSTSKINFLFTVTIRIERQCVVFLCIFITKNESFSRNSPCSNKAAIEMFGTPHFVAMTEFPPYLH